MPNWEGSERLKEHSPGQNSLGAYFTPEPLAQWIASMALQLHQINPPPKKSALLVVDPAVGDGIFLRSLGNIQSHQDIFKIKSSKMRMVGWEIQKNIAKKASLSLQQMIQAEKLSKPLEITYKIKLGDGLLHLLQTSDHYDLILGNPPYLRQETLAPEEKERLVNLLKESIPTLPQSFSKQADYYIYFIFAAIQSLAPGGVLGFLISTSWMNTKFGLGLREWILDHFEGKIIFAHSSKQRLYPEAKINTMVLFVQKSLGAESPPQISLEVWDLHASTTQTQPLQPFTISKRTISPEILQQNVNWETVLFRCPPSYFPIHAQFAPFLLPLNHFAKVATGIYTGLNSFYYVPKNQEDPHPPQRPDDRFLVS
ncbi:MAG: Eco57I restriction-modification methylase domain-containing protein, partial [Promethearchaeota archaeon]